MVHQFHRQVPTLSDNSYSTHIGIKPQLVDSGASDDNLGMSRPEIRDCNIRPYMKIPTS